MRHRAGGDQTAQKILIGGRKYRKDFAWIGVEANHCGDVLQRERPQARFARWYVLTSVSGAAMSDKLSSSLLDGSTRAHGERSDRWPYIPLRTRVVGLICHTCLEHSIFCHSGNLYTLKKQACRMVVTHRYL